MTESEIRDLLMAALYRRIGVNGSMVGEGKAASFSIERLHCVGGCVAEGALEYPLPCGTRLSHASDILVTFHRVGQAGNEQQYISIEIKHTSAVTDQFKCRSYDMGHMKQQLGAALYGIMLFVRAGKGIGFQRAKAICHPFDDFVGVDIFKESLDTAFDQVLEKVEHRLFAG
ncbi:MAG: hypothetical protein O7E51_16385 [Acidobacteria bacterium]|nr:hypothetical protein [Acidobacteriota bacterium]